MNFSPDNQQKEKSVIRTFMVHYLCNFSFFQASTSSIQEKVLKPIIEGEILKILNQPIRKELNLNGPIRFEESYDLRHNVDTLAALLENFTLGKHTGGHPRNYREIAFTEFVPLSHLGPFAVVASSHKSQTKVGTLACFDFFVKE